MEALASSDRPEPGSGGSETDSPILSTYDSQATEPEEDGNQAWQPSIEEVEWAEYSQRLQLIKSRWSSLVALAKQIESDCDVRLSLSLAAELNWDRNRFYRYSSPGLPPSSPASLGLSGPFRILK